MYVLIKSCINSHIKDWAGFWLNIIKFYSTFPKVQAKFQSGEEKSAHATTIDSIINKIDSFPIFQSNFPFWWIFEHHSGMEGFLIDQRSKDSWEHMHKSPKDNCPWLKDNILMWTDDTFRSCCMPSCTNYPHRTSFWFPKPAPFVGLGWIRRKKLCRSLLLQQQAPCPFPFYHQLHLPLRMIRRNVRHYKSYTAVCAHCSSPLTL